MTRTSDNITTRRRLLKGGVVSAFLGAFIPSGFARAAVYATADEARKLIWGDEEFTQIAVTLTKDQKTKIRKLAKTRIYSDKLNVYRSAQGNWFILDQVIGKHEFSDLAVCIDNTGKVTGIEVLEYRESYGHEIINPKWLAQFYGRDNSKRLRLTKEIKNISGATLSCRHVTDGINRLTNTWDLVLKHIEV